MYMVVVDMNVAMIMSVAVAMTARECMQEADGGAEHEQHIATSRRHRGSDNYSHSASVKPQTTTANDVYSTGPTKTDKNHCEKFAMIRKCNNKQL